MATILHLIKSADAALARTVIEQHVGAGDRVTVALLPGAPAPALPPGLTIRRVSSDLSYSVLQRGRGGAGQEGDRKSTRLNSSHITISYAVLWLKKKNL